MTNRFLISVAAAALIAGTGFANAQGAGGAMKEGGAGAAQHSAPAPSAGGGAAAPQRDDSGMKSGQSDRMGGAGKEAQDSKGSKAQPSTASETDRTGKAGKDMKAEGREGREKSTVGQAPDKSGATTKGHDDKAGSSMSRDDKMGQKGEKGSTDTNRAQTNQSGSSTTTGNAATSARVAAPPPEKRTQIVSAIKSERIQESNVNVNVSVGTVLPASVRFVPLPPRIVEIYPEWRGYEVVLIHGRYVIVRPQTREIVYIIEG